jgi:hypothetical protein
MSDDWKRSFIAKLDRVREHWAGQFEEALQDSVVPAFDDLAEFLRDHGFRTSTPARDGDRRAFKFELTEDTYLLMIFRFVGAGSFELLSESRASNVEPTTKCVVARLADLSQARAREFFQTALDNFVSSLCGESAQPAEELVVV